MFLPHKLAQLHEVGDAAGLLEGLVEFTDRLAGNANVLPVVGAQLADHTDGLLEAFPRYAPCRSTPT